MSDFKKKEFANVYASLEFRIKAALAKIEDVRYSIGEIEEELTEIAELSEKIRDVFDAEEELP